MKKIIFSLLVATSLFSTGCLKDKDYEDQKYGILNTETKGIGFVSTEYVVSIFADATPQTIGAVKVGLSANRVPTTDVKYNVVASPTLIPTGTTLLPASAYTFQSTSISPAGSFNGTFEIVVTNASLLDPNLTYGLAFTISSADNGYTVAENSRVVTLEINIRNAYDGIYKVVSGTVTRYTSPGNVENPSTLNGALGGNPDVYLITTGPSSVAIPPSQTVGALYWRFGSNSQVAGIDGLTLSVNPATNLTNMVSATNATLTNWAGQTNNYTPATRTFNLAFRWNPTANVREYQVVLKYDRAR